MTHLFPHRRAYDRTNWQARVEQVTHAKPRTQSGANDRGPRFQIRIAGEQDFMFTVQQTIANAGTATVQVATYALVNRKGVSVDPDRWTIHIGPLAVRGGSADYDINFTEIGRAWGRERV